MKQEIRICGFGGQGVILAGFIIGKAACVFSDFHAVQNGYVSVTPLHLDLTNYAAFDRLRQWELEKLSMDPSDSGSST